MVEERVFFASGDYRLEGLYSPGITGKGVVVTHPHPLYGGEMTNSVVAIVARAYQGCGFSTLRFNFRGVGRSQGFYDHGNGEQEDVRAAVAWMAEKGMRSIDLAGYSFGAWINALTGGNFFPVGRMIMVSPPVGLLDFSSVGRLLTLELAVTGEHDDIAPAEDVRTALRGWNTEARFEQIAGADHFYSGCLDLLEVMLEDRL